jgi:hypothetical protein
MLIAVNCLEFIGCNAPIGAIPFALPYNPPAGTRQVDKEADQNRIARRFSDSPVKRIIGLLTPSVRVVVRCSTFL